MQCYKLDICYKDCGCVKNERCIDVLAFYYHPELNTLEIYADDRAWFDHKPTRIFRGIVDFTMFRGEL